MTLLQTIIETVEQWNQQVELYEKQHPEQSSLLANKEEAAQQLGQKVAQIVLQAMVERSGKGYEGSHLDCSCPQGQLRYQRDSKRTVRTLAGEVRYERAYYYCRDCGASCCPKDEMLGQSRREISAGVERLIALLGAHLSFATSAKVLQEVGRVSLSGRQIETVAEAIGGEAELAEQQSAEQSRYGQLPETAGPKPADYKQRAWVVEMDGVMVGLQSGEAQEVKVGIIYGLEQRAELSPGRWELLERQRCEVRGRVEEFRKRLWALMLRAGVRQDDRIVVVADGAEWIDQSVELLFYGATRIMDFYHTAQRVWAVSGVRFGEASTKAKIWAQDKLRSLKAGEIEQVIAAMKRLKLEKQEAQEVRREAVRYLQRHRAGMAYDEYKSEGLPIGSGAIEGSCKHLVTARCKQAGMRWTEKGVDAILALRCWVLNDRLDELRPKSKMAIEWKQAA
jgi:hypothetical protein